MNIGIDDLEGEQIAALLQSHKREMVETSPQDSVHTLDLDALRSPLITVWSAWDCGEIMGCGALKELDASTAEIKSMCTAAKYRGRGVAGAILDRMLDVARERAYDTIYLETGNAPAFRAAHELYRKAGFSDCGPFAGYEEDAFSRFMVRRL